MGYQKEGFGKFLVTVGLLILFHSAYSVNEWRAYDRKTTPIDETDAMLTTSSNVADSTESSTMTSRGLLGGLPGDIALQTFIGLLVW
jgi:hypothetical protein